MNKCNKLQSKLMKYQTKIYHITLKYDPTTNYGNYQELSLFWLSHMTNVDRLLVKHHAKRTLKLTKKLNKKNKADGIKAPLDYEEENK